MVSSKIGRIILADQKIGSVGGYDFYWCAKAGCVAAYEKRGYAGQANMLKSGAAGKISLAYVSGKTDEEQAKNANILRDALTRMVTIAAEKFKGTK